MRKLAIAAAVSSSLATFSVNSLALGLGDIEMYSALNQALDAEINILSAAPGELDSVQVRIAPASAFDRAGLEMTPMMSAMKFNIERRADGSPIIKVTSDAPVIEPFLNFLIEVDSAAAGRQVREFTVLLDPPVFTAQQTQLAEADVAESEVVDIQGEIGASTPIQRDNADSDMIVTLEEAPVDVAETVSTGVTVADNSESGEYIDLSKEIETSKEVFESVDLAAADNVLTPADAAAPLLENTSGDAAAVLSQTNTITTSSGSELVTNVDEPATQGELIDLTAELVTGDVPSQADVQSSDGNLSDANDGGEIIALDELSGGGRPIFDSESDASDAAGADAGAAVDLTELLPVEMVSDVPAAELADAIDTPAAPLVSADDGASIEITISGESDGGQPVLADSSQDLQNEDLGVNVPLDSLAPIASEAAANAAVVEGVDLADAVAETTVAEEAVSQNTGAGDAVESEIVDLSALQGLEGVASVDDGSAEVIVDKVEVIAQVADSSVVDTDATGIITEDEGIAIDLSGILSPAAGPAPITITGDTYEINAEDTLWSIAEDNRPAGVTTHQMMVALLEANQDAFLNGDMNQMQVGAVLQIPSADAMAAIDKGSAVAMVREQTEFQRASQQFESTTEVAEDSDLSVAETTPVTEEESTDAAADAVNEETPSTEVETEQSPGLTIVGVDDTTNTSGTPATDELSSGTDLSKDLDDVNRRVQLAQEELASEAMQRDELQGRVDDLASSMNKMKRLITLRESELSNLQTELTTDTDATGNAGDTTEEMALTEDSTDSTELSGELAESAEETQNRIREMQEKISDEATLAQDRVAAQADADKNLAAAEAEAQRIRLANEEDELKLQLATLRAEKAELEETSQLEKAELVKAAEEEKAALLAQAQAEKDRIQAQLEDEMARITAAAEEEKQSIAAEAAAENERLIAEANAERDRLAAESERLTAESDQMRQQLEALEAEKNELLAQAELDKQQLQESADENLRLQAEAEAERQRADDQARIRERLAEEQAKATANLASADDTDTQNVVERATDVTAPDDDPDAAGTPSTTENVTETLTEVKDDLAGKGAAAVGVLGGLTAYAPLQRVVGDRARTLATGGGIALLGLLGSWAWRRRSRVVKEDININEPIGAVDDRRAASARGRNEDYDRDNNFDRGDSYDRNDNYDRGDNYDDTASTRRSEGRTGPATVASATAAATAAAAAVRSSEADTSEDSRMHDAAASLEAARADGSMQDDTLTEAEVYLRYGLHGQAEELLSSAIERDPENQDYHLKLLENYHDQKNPNGFRSAAAAYQDRFGATSQWERVAEMGRDLDPGDALYSRARAMDINSAATGAVAGAAATAAAAAGGALSNASDTVSSDVPETAANLSDIDELPDDFLQIDSVDEAVADLDDTLDPGAEFDLSELEATGQFDTVDGQSETTSLEDVTLDEIDLAALDDDGTLNLEEVAGEEMSGLDLGALDFGDVDGDNSLDNLTLDDANLNSLGDVTTSLRDGLESDLESDAAGQGTRVDEMETMLDLAKAYLDMGDNSSAVGPLKDIAANGSPAQQNEAIELLKKIN